MALKSTERRIDELELDVASKQDVLISGTNIKTINSTSLLGSGNLVISGGVSSVGLTTGTTGTDVNVSGSPITSSGSITLNIPTASATNTGKLSSSDWSTFNGKQAALVSGTNIKTINGSSILGSGDISAGHSLGIVAGINVTGTTSMTKSASVLIPANSITQTTVLEVISRAIRVSGTASTIFHQIYINTSDTLTGASLLGVFNSLTATNYISQGIRQVFIDTSVNQLTVLNSGATTPTDYLNTGANTVLTYNPANNYYIIFAVQPFNTGDTTKIQFGLIKKYV